MTAVELRKAEQAFRRAQGRADEARDARNAAVCDAIRDGWTHAQIADVTGLTRARVGQIALTCEKT